MCVQEISPPYRSRGQSRVECRQWAGLAWPPSINTAHIKAPSQNRHLPSAGAAALPAGLRCRIETVELSRSTSYWMKIVRKAPPLCPLMPRTASMQDPGRQ
ncbi:hypothetical protein NCU17135 [Neurospora crassa OR74A]|uniref:Uncharacterized protein n=1 Tax=Neurospora crassa (strain ATCC 24698 / 74-OR23-1A / CBS 708.71 / DSM 1257 / FGSC 987) TaxID=367110 RepID=V5ILP6_NEUCR|nr:hypothetical protein NCU17135 [Neurospora crassa OR74A]ESA42300.1 hypothetical protein NCU17135 [Neurospora crassa OR74A]|eukprot:XP_011395102.1 hypothetical protein NCU17135 [Neurospora crassa OR74A]